jgi:predicted naringenin-chalcone synthase
MNCVIRGLGTALPRQAISQAAAAAVAQIVCCRTEEQAALLPNLYRHTGIATRHMVFGENVVQDLLHGTADSRCPFLPAETNGEYGPTTQVRMERYRDEALPLAIAAASEALRQSGLAAGAISHLVTVSCTGFAAPGVDVGLIWKLGLAPTVQRVHVGFMGCHGAINGLRVAQGFTDSDPRACVLLCAVELCSLHYFYGWDPKRLVANALFADGAAALVAAADTAAGVGGWQVQATGSCLFPHSDYAMTWHIGDHGFEMSLSTRVPALIGEHLPGWLRSWLGQFELAVEDIGSWAVHPGGPRVLSAVEESLQLDADALAVSREVLAECGNMSSPTVLFILDRLRQRQSPRPCLTLAFGPGLIGEAALLR